MTRTTGRSIFVLVFLLALLSGLLTIPAVAQPFVSVERFRHDPGWTAVNAGENSNDFGFRESNLAGADSGEAGGFFSRSDVPVWYGDETVGDLGGDDRLCAWGILNVLSVDQNYNNNVLIGHFDNGGFGSGDQNGIGFQLLENDATSLRVFYLAGTGEGELFDIEGFDQPRTWSYNYNPDAGSFGSLTVSVSGLGGGTATHSLTSEERGSVGSIETFGLAVKPLGNHDTTQLEAYVDNLRYASSDPCRGR